jgi:branched-chain amino acid aminotransferase
MAPYGAAMSTEGKVWIDGRVVPESEARISILDHGFLYGDSVYEAVRTFCGRPFLLDEHLARLERSATGVGIPMPPRLRGAIAEVLGPLPGEARSGTAPDRLLRIILTRGVGPLGYEIVPGQKPTLIVMSRPVPIHPARCYTEGIALAVVSVRRNSRQSLDPALKTSNLLNVRLAYMEARRSGADDALMLNNRGEVAEASGSNVFVVDGGRLWTPPLDAGILEGCTRDFVIQLARRAGLEVREDPMPLDALAHAREAFITSTTRSVMPVARIDGHRLEEAPGPTTRRLMDAFEETVGCSVFPR